MNHQEGPKIVYAGGYEGICDFPDHRHEHAWELVYLCEGSIKERVEGEAREMHPGTFILHPPGVVHGDSACDRYFLYHVLFVADELLGWPGIGSDFDGEPIRAVLGMIVREWYSSGIQRETYLRHCSSLLDLLMKRCAIEAEESLVARHLVAAVCGRFRREFRHAINLHQVSADLHISRSTLYTYFEQVLGRTPQRVLDGIRLKHAVYLLKHSELPIEQVATGSGYCSSSHLGRKLRRAFNITARQVRESWVEHEP